MKPKILILVCFLLFVFSCGAFAGDKPNVVLIVVDTLRQDHLGCYGYNKRTTPNIDALSRDCVIFTQALTPIPLTTPSHTSIFSSLYPQNHKMLNNGGRVDINKKVLAEILQQNGYTTAGFVSVALLDEKTRMNRGFDVYSDKVDGKRVGIRSFQKVAEITIDESLAWLKENKKDPFFLWVHLYDPHEPYTPPDKYIKQQCDNDVTGKYNYQYVMDASRKPNKLLNRDIGLLNLLYDGEIAYVDDQLQRLISYLKENDLYGNSVIIFMADHGQLLGEPEGCYGHAPYVFEGSLRIPLMVKMPGVKPKKISRMVRTIDVMPTLLSYLGIPDNEERDGMDVLPLMKSSNASSPKFAYFGTTVMYMKGIGVRTNDWKYWKDNKGEYLFNINADIKEKDNLMTGNGKKAEELKMLADLYKGTRVSQAAQKPEPDQERIKQLKSLGYL